MEAYPNALYAAILRAVATHRVGDRPDRIEPRELPEEDRPLRDSLGLRVAAELAPELVRLLLERNRELEAAMAHYVRVADEGRGWFKKLEQGDPEARRLWQAVDRPNVMIKIPGTVEGLPAVTRCLAEGINVNVTLIFSLERYGEVMNAYLTGLERRRAAGKPAKVALTAVMRKLIVLMNHTLKNPNFALQN